DERTRALNEVLDRPRRAGHEGTGDAERLASRTDRQKHLLRHPVFVDETVSPRAVHADRVRLVNDEMRLTLLAQFGVIAKRRFVAIHAEERLDDEKTLAAGSKRTRPSRALYSTSH